MWSFLARDDLGGESAARGDPVLIDGVLRHWAGLQIRHILTLGREAFDTPVVDTRATPLSRTLNALTIGTSKLIPAIRVQNADYIAPPLRDSSRKSVPFQLIKSPDTGGRNWDVFGAIEDLQ